MKNNSFDFLDYLIERDLEVFSAVQVAPFFGKVDTKVYVLLDDLVKRGWLTKLKKGLYARNPQGRKGDAYMPNWHKVAAGLMYPKDYYIGFYSALQIHELITQPMLIEYIVTSKRVIPKVQLIQGVEFEIFYYQSNRFFGFTKTWINDHEKVYCSDLEKTIIDCLYQPQYAGGMEGIVKAIYKARNKIRPNVLVAYATTFNVQVVMKRLGFLLDRMNLYQTEQNILNQLITESYTRLDPSIQIKGTFHRKWRIEDNVDFDDIIKTIDT
jgi:predicted transcriptional regulator of viral defense system